MKNVLCRKNKIRRREGGQEDGGVACGRETEREVSKEKELKELKSGVAGAGFQCFL